MKTATGLSTALAGLILATLIQASGATPPDGFTLGRSMEERSDARLRLHGEWVAKRREKAREAWRLCQANPELRAKGLDLCLEHDRKPPASRYGPAEPYMNDYP